ncbi:Phosphatase PAP2 family protein [Caenorhabditis elegans]|uniref:Phosphatase PAP2 family protein n=1 Tax=Caenorhabditis elegans TaxID=6239 RepID=A0A3B1E530_CAEEL|nr:Phosphatase PAP2 family protein [Caenorhabditis elegans]VAY52630.1 Phosphatase PAP2 family protein [Caenorhabditis elegans]|eukprot:NP_001355492.1 Uncharacterized protein CELE_M163.22 [Caenorhabditis elegans]
MNLRKKISAFLDAIKNWEDPDFCLPEDEMGGFQYFFLHSETVDGIFIPLLGGLIALAFRLPVNIKTLILMRLFSVFTITMAILRLCYFLYC